MASSEEKDDYFMKAGGEELERLQLQHKVFRLNMQGLMFAPVDLSGKNLRILDSATADGAWLLDLRQCLPDSSEHQFVGTDVETSWFPTNAPAETTFQRQSITDEWPKAWTDSFDYVHQRLVLACVGDYSPKQSVSNLLQVVKPGGWIELLESDLENHLDNGPAMCRWISLTAEVFQATGISPFFSKNLESWLVDCGVQEVNSRYVDLKYGALNDCPDTVEMTTKSILMAAHAIVSAANSINLQTEIKYDDLIQALEREVRQQGAIFRQRVVWGRRPA